MAMHMGHVALRVEDVDAYAAHIAEALGLHVISQSFDEAFLATQETRPELQLIRADRAAFDHVGLMVETPEELDGVVERALAAGGQVEERAAEPGCDRSAWVVGPGGVCHQLYLPERRVPLTAARNLGSQLRRYGHLTFLSDEADELVRFWGEGLGFRLSDTATGFTWMRCDAYHHSLAVGPHPAATVLHHHAWEIQDVSALCKHCDRNALAGRPQAWGPVRHGPGFNLATYMPDLAGSLIEVYADLLMIEDDANYVPVDWSDEPLALNLWGTMPPPEVLQMGVPVVGAVAA